MDLEPPELRSFLDSLRPGELLSGVVAALEPFGVFVQLDDGPRHPIFPGVGFISIPELSWVRIGAASDVVRVGQRVRCEVLRAGTDNGEARLSLRATVADPMRDLRVGQVLDGVVSRVVPIGAFVRVPNGLEGLIHERDLDARVRRGDPVIVVVTRIDVPRRRLAFVPRGQGAMDRTNSS
ncbi:S1 RNA-binding domain-containing protein [Nonomuraea insulae]|uniref:S1 RNA-binding domain-containing protein n=1 Tax=Nonomuraea insulae TaxID=1616787 RepID=A0ABW1CQ01_9ACTN